VKRTDQLITVPGLLAKAWRDFWANRWGFLGIAAVITIPATLLQLAPSLGDNQVVQAYLAIGALVMTVALIWAIVRLAEGRRPRVRQAYYEGTTAFVKFAIVFLILTLQLLPFAIGATIYITAIQADITTAERLIFATIWLLLALPSFYWLNRYLFGLLIVHDPAMTPVMALRASGRLVRGRFWMVFRRVAALMMLFLAVLLGVLTAASALIHNQNLTLGILRLVANLLILPLFYLALYWLYHELRTGSGQPKPLAETESTLPGE